MPIYAYRCNKCGAEEEHIQGFNDAPMTTCEACGGGLERLLSAAAFVLKGGGWYKDGYASTKPKDSSGSGSDGGKTSDGGKKSDGPKKSDGGQSSAKAAAE